MTEPEHPAPADGLDLAPDVGGLADSLRSQLHAAQARPSFRDQLRAELIASRTEAVAARSSGAGPSSPSSSPVGRTPREPAPVEDGPAPTDPAPREASATRPVPGTEGGRLLHLPARRSRRRVAAWTAAAAVVVTAGSVTVDRILTGPGTVGIAAASDLQGAISANPATAVLVSFSRPVDQASVTSALRISPATQVRTSWAGDLLTVSAVHGFSPNTSYTLDVDRTVARAATGARLASDVGITFGTAPVAQQPAGTTPPVDLVSQPLTAAADGSEAAFTAAGAMLVTGAEPGAASVGTGLVRVAATAAPGGTTTIGATTTLAPATDAICVSRSGQSVAFLAHPAQGTDVVFADADGNPAGRAAVAVDAGSPIGWIDDADVSFVGGHELRAVDRQGHVRVLSTAPVDVAKDTLVIAPGGRYVYLRPASAAKDTPGQVLDLNTGAWHPLPGSLGQPAFSSDGATVAWIDGRGQLPRLATSASAGGPVLTAPLPVGTGDQISGLSVAPDGAQFAYVVTPATGEAQLRLASLADGHTLAVLGGGGESVDWAPSSRSFSVLRAVGGGSWIDTVQVPLSVTGRYAAAQAIASAFARTQVGGDSAAAAALAVPGLHLPSPPRLTRSELLWLDLHPDGTAGAQLRLSVDPTSVHGTARTSLESLTLSAAGEQGVPAVTAATVTAFRDAPDGPQLAGSEITSPGSVALRFDSDLDPSSIAAAVTVTSASGTPLGHRTTFVAGSRTVTVQVTDTTPGAFTVVVQPGLRDVSGHHLQDPVTVPVTPSR